MSRRPTSVVVVLLAVLAASCALEATGTAPTSTTTTGAGPTTGAGAGGDQAASSTGGPATGGGGASSSDGGGGPGPTTGTGGGGAGTGGEAASSAGGGGGAEPPTCGDGIVEGAEECDGPAPCDRCVMVCPEGWTKAPSGTCYGRARYEGDGDEVVDRCDGTRDQVEIDAAVVLRPATPDVVADLATVAAVCGDEIEDDGCWIGADDLAVEGTFTWVSGEDFTYGDGVAPWAEGEPSGEDDDENCGEVLGTDLADRLLHDDMCWRTQRVICEIVPPGEPAEG